MLELRARALPVNRDHAVKTAIDRAAEAIEAAEITFAREMGATLDLTPAARVALIEKIAATIRTVVGDEQQNLELSSVEALALLDLIDQRLENGRLPQSLHRRTLRGIRAKLQRAFPETPAPRADTEVT
jgi:hypothetical protein